ncbi:hypothetical protein O0I10_011298 [Lichtheimia ornata]|uniref:F-box domain-containing protein n=1 Tax=Lichtheimia ornata TaxID=688661 RepID=A0AAD7XU82_9FUNG|nr:uncharacterized protein O0I10_011298 [Lichtheimia ornata]KAJ8653078.1 hypothetical protein O0I10_011298 [Lichtheimia ornata]
MAFHLLPTEVFDLVAMQLPTRDHFQCLLVNKTWCDIFLPVLYRSVPLTHKCNILPILRNPARSIGRHVRKLVVDDGILSLEAVGELQALCPLLRELEFCWPRVRRPIVGSSSSSSSNSGSGNRGAHCSPVPILEAIDTRELRTLRLTCNGDTEAEDDDGDGEDDEDDDDDDDDEPVPHLMRRFPPRGMMESLTLPSILQFTAHVESLSLINVLPILRTTELDTIHAACPRLRHLVVEGSNMVLTPIVTDKVHPSLHTLRITYPSGWSRTDLWIDYIITHYPNLRSLDLVNTSKGSSVIRPVSRGPTSLDLAHRPLPQQLSHLRLIRLGDYGNDGQYLTPLTLLPALSNVEIKSQRPWHPDTWLRAVKDRVDHLSIDLPADSLPYYGDAIQTTLMVLGDFQRLVDLRIDMTRLGGVYDILMHACPPTLKYLALLNGVFDFVLPDTSLPTLATKYPNITRLTLDNMLVLDNDMLTFAITVYCPNLIHFNAIQCVWLSCSRNTPVVNLDFATHSFASLSFSQSRMITHAKRRQQQQQQHSTSSPIQCYGFVCDNKPSPSSSSSSSKESIGRKRQRASSSHNTPWFITLEDNNMNNENGTSSRATGFRIGKQAEECIIIKCKEAKQLWIEGYQV